MKGATLYLAASADGQAKAIQYRSSSYY